MLLQRDCTLRNRMGIMQVEIETQHEQHAVERNSTEVAWFRKSKWFGICLSRKPALRCNIFQDLLIDYTSTNYWGSCYPKSNQNKNNRTNFFQRKFQPAIISIRERNLKKRIFSTTTGTGSPEMWVTMSTFFGSISNQSMPWLLPALECSVALPEELRALVGMIERECVHPNPYLGQNESNEWTATSIWLILVSW